MSVQISEFGLFVLASFGIVFLACRYGGKLLIRLGWKSLEIDTRSDEKPRDGAGRGSKPKSLRRI